MKQNDCPICRHVERKLIDHAISEGRPDSFFAANFAADSSTVEWHRENCLGGHPDGEAEAADAEAEQSPSRKLTPAGRASGQRARLRELHEAAGSIMDKAADSEKHWRTALSAIAAASRLIALEAKLAERKAPPAPKLAETAEWQQLKLRILRALEPFPEARRALMEALADDQA